MIQITVHKDGILLPVKAQPGAKRNAVVGEHDGMLKIAVTQKPEAGKANEAILELLANSLGLRRSQLKLFSGATNRYKKILLTNIGQEDLRTRLTNAF